MSLKPQLVKDKDGKLCVQLALGTYCATLPLPDDAVEWPPERLKELFDRVVPEMTKGLIAMRTDEQRKMRRKACAKSSTGPSPDSEAKILQLPRPI